VAVSASVAFVCLFIDGIVSLEQPGIGIWLYLFAGVAVASGLVQRDSANEKALAIGSGFMSLLGAKRLASLAISFLLLISSFALSQRIYFDGILRSNVQTVLMNNATAKNVLNIELATIKLRFEPEYATQALKPLAALGDGAKLDSISKAVYDYYPKSIQSSFIRANVLKALNRGDESCPIHGVLIENTPWDISQLENYIDCSVNGYIYQDIIKSLTKVDQFSSEVDRTEIPSDSEELKNVSYRLNLVSVRARFYFILGQVQSARNLQVYGNILLARLLELQGSNSTLVTDSEVNIYEKRLKF
jgi:hypothetical protein